MACAGSGHIHLYTPRLWTPSSLLVPVLEGWDAFSLIAGRESPALSVVSIVNSYSEESRNVMFSWAVGCLRTGPHPPAPLPGHHLLILPRYRVCVCVCVSMAPPVVRSRLWGVSMRHKLGSAMAINKMGGLECQAQATLQVTRSSPLTLTLHLTSRGCLCSCPGGARQWSGPESR